MKENRIRAILNEDKPCVSTRVESIWPTVIELIGSTGKYDYVEFVAEYAPYNLTDFENMARAAELHNMGTMIKADMQNRGYVMQKAVASGFQGVLLCDHRTAAQVEETIAMIRPETPGDGGSFGYPNARWIGYQPYMDQMDYAAMVRDIVVAVMIEKKEAMENIEAICALPGVDILQFGPSDYAMSCGWNKREHAPELKDTEKRMIECALKHGKQPRCEIMDSSEAEAYRELGVKHFCIGDELKILAGYWSKNGSEIRKIAER